MNLFDLKQNFNICYNNFDRTESTDNFWMDLLTFIYDWTVVRQAVIRYVKSVWPFFADTI